METITLEQYQTRLKKWQNKSLADTENSIRLFYRKLVKDSLAELGEIYSNYEQNGVLTYTEMAKYNRLSKFMDSLTTHINTASETTQKSIDTLLRDSYEYSYYWMGYAVETSTMATVGYAALTPEIIDAALNNPVKGLTLDVTYEKYRRDIIYQVQQNVTRGLANGSTYRTMANELQKVFNDDYEKAIRVVRTEAHRVNERATLDSMQRANSKGIRSTKRWRNSKDSRVRKTTKANHVKMDQQEVPVDDMFDLGNGKKGIAPGNTGYPEDDIHCRCFLVYDVVAVEMPTNDELVNIVFLDWKKTLK